MRNEDFVLSGAVAVVGHYANPRRPRLSHDDTQVGDVAVVSVMRVAFSARQFQNQVRVEVVRRHFHLKPTRFGDRQRVPVDVVAGTSGTVLVVAENQFSNCRAVRIERAGSAEQWGVVFLGREETGRDEQNHKRNERLFHAPVFYRNYAFSFALRRDSLLHLKLILA